jgi:RNA polymerase sigma-70 factor (ECF subfamily)
MALASWPLEEYRDYLKLLAEAMLSPDIRQRLDSSDVAQEAVLKAHKALETFQGTTECEWLAWLRSIVENVMRDLHRRHTGPQRDVRRERSLQAFNESSARLDRLLANGAPQPQENASREENLARLAKAVAALPEDQQTAVKLYYLQELPVKAIAQKMERTEESVGGLLYRGLKTLRRRMRLPDGS